MSPIPTNPRQSLKNRKNTCFCPASPASTLLSILWQITLSVAATPQFPSHRTQGLEGASSLERPKKKIKKSEKKDKDKKKTKKKKSSSHWLHEVVSLALAVRFAWLYRPSVCCESEAARTQTPRLLAETPRSALGFMESPIGVICLLGQAEPPATFCVWTPTASSQAT